MIRLLDRRLLVVLLAVSMTLPLIPLGSDHVRSQETCTTLRSAPLWIRDVSMFEGSETREDDDDTFDDVNGSIYAETDTDLRFEITIENRFDDECAQETGELTNELSLKTWYLHGGDHHNETDLLSCQGTSGRSNIQASEVCTIERRLPNPDGRVEGPAGEQRVRFVLFDADADDDGNNLPDDCASATTDADPGQQGACAGAERVFVVGQLPDLTIDDIDWTTDESERHTTYHRENNTFDVVLSNDGDYPNWNPNGQRGTSEYWGRSSYDGDGDGEADDKNAFDGGEETYDYEDELGPPCRWQPNPEEADGGEEFRCSYRRGQKLQIPILHEVRRESNGPVVENATHLTYNTLTGDKVSSLLPGDTRNQEIEALDKNMRAGDFDVTAIADEGENGANVPEADDDNNDENRDAELLGVDLAITDPRVVVVTPSGAGASCPKSDPCPVDSTIELDPRYRNVGDDALDATQFNHLRDIDWVATVYVNDENETWDEQEEVPKSRSNTSDPERVFTLEQQIEPDSGGGEHRVAIRLDHPDNYEGADPPITDERGKVGERNEQTECPAPSESLDNTYCVSFWFEDQNPPNLQGTSIETDSSDGEVPHVREGERVSFEANLTDSSGDEPDDSLTNVTALFEHTNGTAATFELPNGSNVSQLAMTRTEEDGRIWNVSTELRGDLGRYVYKIRAEDLNHTIVSSGTEFELTKLDTEIEVKGFVVNDQPSTVGPDAPRYRGNASEPRNYFNITSSINGTGHDEADLAENVSVEVQRPNGTTHAWASPNTTQRCRVSTITGDVDQRTGPACQAARDSQQEDVEDSWTWYYVNSTHRDFELDWAGTFNVSYHVSDKFDRNSTKVRTAEIRDKLNANGEPEPVLENATVSPKSVDPDGDVQASAEARDVLRVEGVELNVTKPSGDQVAAPLGIDELENQDTRNGTYASSFDVGPEAPYFDQGGTYSVHVDAEDFAGNVNASDAISVAVNDTDRPEIVDLRTIPGDAQEVGGRITWVVQVEDQTAVRPPVLRITKPTSGSTGPNEMVFNESEDRWKFGPVNVTEVDVGTWTYEVTVEDYTGKQTSASGDIRVEDNLPPQDQRWSPNVIGPDGASYGPPSPQLSVQIVDFGQGVNRSSIHFAVNGENRTTDAEITPIGLCDRCYRLNYTPSEAFEAGSTVDALVEAADRSDPPRVNDKLRHQFKVDAEPPRASLEMGPKVLDGDRRVIGLPTDVNVSVTDGGSGPGTTEVTVADSEVNGSSQTLEFERADASFQLQEFDQVVQGHGAYQIFVEATDAVGNTDTAVQQAVLFDERGPSIEVFAKPGKPRELVFANVTDDSRVQKVLARYSVDGGPDQTLRLEEDNGTWSVRLFNQRTDQAFEEGSTVRFTVEATDVFGNLRATSQKNFTAGDSVPTVDFTSPDEGSTVSGTTELAWRAQDAETAAENLKISLFYKKPDGKFQEIPGAQDIPNRGSYRLDTTDLPNGAVTLQVFVLDGQNFAADEVNVTVRNLGETFAAPEIEDAERSDGTPTIAPGQESTFRVQIDGDVRRAWANITRGDEVVESVELENEGGSTWASSFTAPTERGNYSVTLSAVTAEGVQEAPEAYGFAVQGSPTEADKFIPEWTLLIVLTAAAVALGVLGLRNRWT